MQSSDLGKRTAEPQSTPKRLHEATTEDPEGASSEQPLTRALVQQSLQENSIVITDPFQETLQGINNRVTNVEQSVDPFQPDDIHFKQDRPTRCK